MSHNWTIWEVAFLKKLLLCKICLVRLEASTNLSDNKIQGIGLEKSKWAQEKENCYTT
jgi:hypothetical protein